MKTLTMFMAFTDITAQATLGQQQGVGGQKDAGGCYTGAGFCKCLRNRRTDTGSGPSDDGDTIAKVEIQAAYRIILIIHSNTFYF